MNCVGRSAFSSAFMFPPSVPFELRVSGAWLLECPLHSPHICLISVIFAVNCHFVSALGVTESMFKYADRFGVLGDMVNMNILHINGHGSTVTSTHHD